MQSWALLPRERGVIATYPAGTIDALMGKLIWFASWSLMKEEKPLYVSSFAWISETQVGSSYLRKKIESINLYWLLWVFKNKKSFIKLTLFWSSSEHDTDYIEVLYFYINWFLDLYSFFLPFFFFYSIRYPITCAIFSELFAGLHYATGFNGMAHQCKNKHFKWCILNLTTNSR